MVKTTGTTKKQTAAQRQKTLTAELEQQLQILVNTARNGVSAAIFGHIDEAIRADTLLHRIFITFDGLIQRKVEPAEAARTIASIFAGIGRA